MVAPMPSVTMRRISLPTVDITYLDVDGERIAAYDHDRKDCRLPAHYLNKRQFQAVLYSLILIGCHWGYCSPAACDDLHAELEIELGIRDEPG